MGKKDSKQINTRMIFKRIKKAFEAVNVWLLLAWETVKTPEFWVEPSKESKPLKKSKGENN